MLNETAKNLNDISRAAESHAKCKASVFTRFYAGKIKDKLAAVINTLAPNGKIAAVYTDRSFAAFGEQTAALVSSFSGSTSRVILKNGVPSVKDAGALLAAAEDARFILAFDADFYGLAAYVATVARVPAVLAVNNLGFREVVPSRTLLKNGDCFDYVKVRAPRYVLLDENVYKTLDVPAVYSSVIGRLSDFTDYRIACAVKKYDADKRAYSVLKDAVSSAFGVFTLSAEKRAELLLCSKFKAELANLATDGALSDFSAFKNASRLCVSSGNTAESESLYILCRIMGLYNLYFSGRYDDVLEIPDYLSRADKIVETAKCEELTALRSLKAQCELYSQTRKTTDRLKNELKDEISAQTSVAEKTVKTYFALGGKDRSDKKIIDFAVKYSGDLPDCFNGMTLVRESGIGEYI